MNRTVRVLLGRLLLCCATTTASAALFGRTAGSGNGNSKIALRKRLHVNTLITEPGTMEVDWSNLYSFSNSNFTMPSGIRYTPEGSNIFWGRTEYGVAFDSISSANIGASRLTQFSQAVTLSATSVIHDGEKFDFAIAPQAMVFLRDESGLRLGAVAIARYDTGRNSIGGTVSWSAATHNSPSNPAGTFDVGFGFGRQLSGSRLLEKFTPHVNAEWERSTGLPRALLASEGVEYQVTERLAFDVSGQQVAGAGNPSDHQIAFGITLSLGRLR
jgi:hypothetical protein